MKTRDDDDNDDDKLVYVLCVMGTFIGLCFCLFCQVLFCLSSLSHMGGAIGGVIVVQLWLPYNYGYP
jgi:hypothetical protein